MDPRYSLIRRLALLCAITVLAVTSLSAYLRLAKAGLGCAEWPQCYGQNFKRLQQGLSPSEQEQTATAVARLAHRVTAVLALLLVITLVMVSYGARPMLHAEGATALALLVLALLLAVLGRWSAGARVPAVAMGNLLGGLLMLALCVRLAVAGRGLKHVGLRGWVLAALLLLLVQVALGALVNASYASLSCNAWGECFQAALGMDASAASPWREPALGALPEVNPSGALAQALHRGTALLLAGVLVPLALLAWRRGRPRTGAVLLVLLAAQLALGVAMGLGVLPLEGALLHNQLAGGLLAALVLLL